MDLNSELKKIKAAMNKVHNVHAPKRRTAYARAVVFHAKKEPAAQIAHLVFADTQANIEKPKKLFFSQRST